jgi:hypothetical protein
VLAIALVLRVAAGVAYRPALMWDDSWEYVSMAWHAAPLPDFAPDHPSGYPAILWVLSVFGHHLWLIAVVQHLAGLAVGLLAYWLLRRLGVGRALATAGAAVVLLDGYAIALEQYVLSETFFGLAMVGCAAAAIRARSADTPSAGWWVLSGGLLAGAATIRSAALFAVPVWIVFLLVSRPGLRRASLSVAALALPLLAYCALHAADGLGFGMTQAGGWLLYGRVGAIVDCPKMHLTAQTAPLCRYPAPPGPDFGSPGDYIFSPKSPAVILYTDLYTDPPRSNPVLKRFALEAIRANPGGYAKAVADDFLAYFDPAGGGMVSADWLPARGQDDGVDADTKATYLSQYRRQWHTPYRLIRGYVLRVHTPRWLIGGFLFAACVELLLALGPRLRRRLPRAAEVGLLAGMATATLLGAALTAQMEVRYLVPVVALFTCGGLVAFGDLCGLAGRVRVLGRWQVGGRAARGGAART